MGSKSMVAWLGLLLIGWTWLGAGPAGAMAGHGSAPWAPPVARSQVTTAVQAEATVDPSPDGPFQPLTPQLCRLPDSTLDPEHAGAARLPDVPDWLSDSPVPELVWVNADAAAVDATGPVHMALPPGVSAADVASPSHGIDTPEQVVEWHVDNGRPALRINFRSGVSHGVANRFDPTDNVDDGGAAPMALRIRRIHFMVNAEGEPTGPMEWHVWEDNGGHKADVGRDIVPPLVVTGAPGHNVIDLDALGRTAVIDPPRMFHVGVAKKASETTSPDVLMDDGLPFVGGSGDFHGSLSGYAFPADITTMYCGKDKWMLLGFNVADGDPRSPAFMIWLDVEWLGAPEERYFDRVAGDGVPFGAFEGGSRIAWGDYDNDGDEDILASGSKLFRNDGLSGFVDVTATAGITDTGSGALWADYDNDGDLDFYQYTSNCVPCGQADNYDDLWRNRGDGTFENVRAVDYGGAADAPVPRDPLPTEGAAWGDFNNDGYLDLYSANHVDWDTGVCFDDYLWLNDGPPNFSFTDVSVEAGVRAATLCGRGVSPSDFDEDGDLDIFVSNYRLNPDLLWVNDGVNEAGVPRFIDRAAELGVRGVAKLDPSFAGSFGHTIGAVWGDLDRDGDPDLVAANLAHSAWLCFSDTTMVYQSLGPSNDHRFRDVREASGVKYVETHSDPSLVDIDNDGYLDLHLTHVYDGWRTSMYRNATGDATAPRPSIVFLPSLQRGPSNAVAAVTAVTAVTAVRPDASVDLAASIAQLGPTTIRFDDVTHRSGVYPRTSWGSAWSDYDNDGDVDLAARGLWRNRARPDGARHFLQVEARGCGQSNRDAIGARVRLSVADPAGWSRLETEHEIVGARGTGSQDSRVVHVGLGVRTVVGRLEVAFPSGQTWAVDDLEGIDRRITVTEVGAILRPSAWAIRLGEDVSVHADTCGEQRVVDWDLDGDGVFDDASGTDITHRPTELGTWEIAARVSDGSVTSVATAAVEIKP